MKTAPRGKTFWRTIGPYFTNNLAAKLLSIVGALVLYFVVHGSQDAQRTMAVDLVVLLPPDNANRALITPLPTSVLVSIHGPRSLVDDLRPSDLGNLQLDLRSGRSGRMQLDSSMLSVPAGATVDYIDPASLDIAWDEMVDRDIHVLASIAGEPAEGYIVRAPPTADPPSIRVRGPRQVVDSISYLRTEPFDVNKLAEGTHNRDLQLDRPPPRVSFNVTSVKATVHIARQLLDRKFAKLGVVILGSPRATSLPSRVDVSVTGPPQIVEALRAEQIVPRVDLKDLAANVAKPNSVAMPVIVDLAGPGLEVRITPPTVVVKW